MMMDDTADIFKCIWCDYIGSEGWRHIKEQHHDKIVEWIALQKDQPQKEPEIIEIREDKKLNRYTITRRIEFDAGHRVYGHESKCANIHGHRYQVLIECSPKDTLDDLGRVIDFSVIKDIVGTWIDDKLDHGMILFKDDPLISFWDGSVSHLVEDCEGQKFYVMDKNPTAENIAELIYHKAADLLRIHDITVTKITVWETPNCKAEYTCD